MSDLDKIIERTKGHTPGPWADPEYENIPGDRGWWIFNGKSGSEEGAIAVTFCLNPKEEKDAELISSAPDLLRIATEQREQIRELREALEESEEAIQASYSQAYAEWWDHQSIEERCDATIRRFRARRRTVLDKNEETKTDE